MKNLSAILAFGLLILFGLACNFSVGTGTGNTGTGNTGTAKTGVISVESATLAKDNGGKPGQTVTAFDTSDNVQYFVVNLNEGKAGTRVKGVFTAVDAGDETNQKMAETEVVTADDNQNKVDFHITLPSGFPPGDYKADFYLNDKPAKTLNYKVQ